MAQLPLSEALKLAIRHHQAGRLAEADAIYQQILEADPNHADALHWRGLVLLRAGRQSDALQLINQALSLRPNWPDASTCRN